MWYKGRDYVSLSKPMNFLPRVLWLACLATTNASALVRHRGWCGVSIGSCRVLARTPCSRPLPARLRTACATWLLPLLLLTPPAALEAQFQFVTNNGAITITGYTGPGGAVIIPSSTNGWPITAFGDEMLQRSGLTSVTIPESVTNIPGGAFAYNPKLTAITVDTNNPSYSSLNGVLFNRNQTTLVEYPGGKAGAYTIPNSVTSIGFSAFDDCTNLTGVTIGNNVTSIGKRAFSLCYGLTNVTIPDSVTSIGDAAFYSCRLTATTIPNSVTNVGDSAFGFCTRLTSVTIGTNISSVGGWAFEYCTSLTSITIPNSVTNIGYSAFAVCTSLTNVTIGNGITSIGTYAFDGCTSLTSLTIPDNVRSIGLGAFELCTSLTRVTIPDGVTSIEAGAFYECTRLTNVTIGDGVMSIGGDAFYDCTSLTSITIGDSVTSIGAQAFEQCTSLTSVTIGDSVTSIGVQAFEQCTSLTSVIIPNSVTSIGDYAFLGCTSLTNLPIGDGVTSFGDFAFCQCTNLTSVTIPDSVRSIGAYAFEQCPSLTNVTIGDGVTSIGDYAFWASWESHGLTGIYFKGNAPTCGLNIFEGDDHATVYYLPGTAGWGQTFGGRRTALWFLPNPLILPGTSFGVRANRFCFIISWATNIPVVVEACTNLANPLWSPVRTNIITGGSSYFSDPQWTNYPDRFYRLRSP